MTDLAQFLKSAERPEPGQFSDPAESRPFSEPNGDAPRPSTARRAWRLIGWLTAGVIGGLATAWFIFLGPGELGSKAQWFFGAVVLCVVMVSMWQVVTIQRLARLDASEAGRRHRTELAAAEQRAEHELAMAQRLHRTQIESQQRLHDAEMEAQRELARVERVQLLAQQQRLAIIGVSRAVNAQTQVLATLWNQGANMLSLEDREAREQAMNPVFEQLAQVVNDFSIELADAHLLIEDDRLHRALARVNEAVLMAMQVAQEVHLAVVEGRAPDPNQIPSAQRLMHERAAEARHLAWDLLRAGLDDTASD